VIVAHARLFTEVGIRDHICLHSKASTGRVRHDARTRIALMGLAFTCCLGDLAKAFSTHMVRIT
jgi:hypothetical protein